ncbi:MAG: hypothetical protein ABT940_08380 [Alphaproteobacteria bacterium]
MSTQHEKLKDLAGRILNDWEKAFADPDEQVTGSDAVESLGQYVELAQDALTAEAPTPRPRKKKLKFFDNHAAVVDYIASEMVSTLEDDYGNMCDKHERRNYSAEDRREMSRKIQDVRLLADLLPGMLEALERIASMRTEEEMEEGGMVMEDASMTLSELIVTARQAIGLTKKGR